MTLAAPFGSPRRESKEGRSRRDEAQRGAPDGALAAKVLQISRFWGTELNLSARVQPVFSDHLRLFAGFRYFELSEALCSVFLPSPADAAAISLGFCVSPS